MSRSHKDFVAMIELGEGDHEYKFLVDGQWITDSGAPTVENNSGKTLLKHTISKKFNHRLLAENGLWIKILAYSIITKTLCTLKFRNQNDIIHVQK